MKRVSGFSLIELMVVIAIIGVIASIATGAYESYVEQSQSVMVNDNYNAAVKYVESRYVRAESLVAMGIDLDEVIPADAAGWIALINTNGKSAPTAAGAAFVEGTGSAALGSVGIEVAGDYSAGTSAVTITQPAFSSLPETATVVTQSDF